MMTGMEREVVHLSHAEAIRDIAAILERVEQGAEVIVEKTGVRLWSCGLRLVPDGSCRSASRWLNPGVRQ